MISAPRFDRGGHRVDMASEEGSYMSVETGVVHSRFAADEWCYGQSRARTSKTIGCGEGESKVIYRVTAVLSGHGIESCGNIHHPHAWLYSTSVPTPDFSSPRGNRG